MAEPAIFESKAFRAEREGDWCRLHELLKRAERRGVSALSDEDLLELPVLYRAALSSLSVARSTSLDIALIGYLETLSTRAYFFLYGVRGSLGRLIMRFFASGWPAAVRAIWPEIVVSALVMLAGALTGYLLVVDDPGWFHALIPPDIAQGRVPGASVESLRDSLGAGENQTGLAVFATALFTHNAQITIVAFALGFAFGVPTMLLILYNGATVGAFVALYAEQGLGGELGGWLLIHGSTELSAIILAGAAGLHIGRRVAFPGRHSRLAAAREAGKIAARVMIGAILMLLVAGLLEGFARQLVTETWARYAIAAIMFAIWVAYFSLPWARRDDG